MSAGYILSQAGNKIGLDTSVEQRAILLRLLNEAADELYAESDPSGCLVEQVFRVNGDQTISMPANIKYIRAMREFASQIPWNITQLRPRYNISNWPDIWRNWRLKGIRPLKKSVTNQSVITVSIAAVETPPIVVTVTGPTSTADNRSETFTMDAVSKSGTLNFLDITSAIKDRVSEENVTISDVEGNELTVIPNNQVSAMYQHIDVSLLPWSTVASGQQDHYVEVLYKKALPYFKYDSDEFPAIGYDNILVNKIIQLYKEEQDKPESALLYDAKATRGLARKHEDENRATNDKVSLAPNPHDQLIAPIRKDRPGLYPFPFGLRGGR